MELIAIKDFKCVSGVKYGKPLIVEYAKKELKKENKYRKIKDAEIFCPLELMLKCSEIVNVLECEKKKLGRRK